MLEESLKKPTSSSSNRVTPRARSSSNGPSRRQSLVGAETSPKHSSSNGSVTKSRPSSQPRSLTASASSILKHAKGTSTSFDGGTRSLDRNKVQSKFPSNHQSSEATNRVESPSLIKEEESDDKSKDNDSVPGVLYDLLQKEVITLRKAAHEKDQSLRDKDDSIEVVA